jgi:uncharacterized RDD family membrane protein YckC
MSSTPGEPERWPGQDLGLPAEGPRSVGRLGRRVLALAIDWAAATALSLAITRPASMLDSDPWVTLAVFAAMQIVFLPVLSGSFGHLCVGLRVVPVRPAWIGIVRPIVRTVLIVLVIPAVIWDRDQRGLHDRAAGTVLVRR